MYIVRPFSLEEAAVAAEGEKMYPLHEKHQTQESVTHLRGYMVLVGMGWPDQNKAGDW